MHLPFHNVTSVTLFNVCNIHNQYNRQCKVLELIVVAVLSLIKPLRFGSFIDIRMTVPINNGRVWNIYI